MAEISSNLEKILNEEHNYVVYVLKCKKPGYVYVGYTNDFYRRLKEHENGKGAEFTRFYGVEKILHIAPYSSKEEAMKKETMFTLYCMSKLYSTYSSKCIDHVAGGKYTGVIKSLSDRVEILKTLREYMISKEKNG